jgi:hypothetical protein
VCFARPLGLKQADYDTELPSNADFTYHSVPNLVFIHFTKLTAIMVEVAGSSGHHKEVPEADTERLTTRLIQWISQLPEEIRLYDASGIRRPYLESISELHLLYFVTVIFLEAMHKKQVEQWSTSILALIASSCAIRLLEEIDCREDVSSMSSVTTWFMMVIAIPQLYYRPQASTQEELRQEELDILSGVIEQLRPKYGGANVVRRNIDRIRRDVARHPHQCQADRQDETTANADGGMAAPRHLKDLFPFPKSLCLNLELLGADVNELPELAMNFLPFGNDGFSWTFNEPQSWPDTFGFNALGTGDDTFSQSLGPFDSLMPGDMM